MVLMLRNWTLPPFAWRLGWTPIWTTPRSYTCRSNAPACECRPSREPRNQAIGHLPRQL